jgi:hypothetical protein
MGEENELGYQDNLIDIPGRELQLLSEFVLTEKDIQELEEETKGRTYLEKYSPGDYLGGRKLERLSQENNWRQAFNTPVLRPGFQKCLQGNPLEENVGGVLGHDEVERLMDTLSHVYGEQVEKVEEEAYDGPKWEINIQDGAKIRQELKQYHRQKLGVEDKEKSRDRREKKPKGFEKVEKALEDRSRKERRREKQKRRQSIERERTGFGSEW